MTDTSTVEQLLQTLEDAADLVKDYSGLVPEALALQEPLPSLLQQCEALTAPDPEPLRSVHQFACTGGTLICKLLSTMPNVTLLSEIDPLSPRQMVYGSLTKPQFRPTDLLYGARFGLRPIDDQTIIEVFRASVDALYREIDARGGHLVLRDHAHSQFCSEADWDQRPTLRELLQELGSVKSVVTVRHPLDSFLSVDSNGWRHFQPFTLDEYAKRYNAFLKRHADAPVYRYEDFVKDPDHTLEEMCNALALPFVPYAESLLPILKMSGDSGRRSHRISTRRRREIPKDILRQAKESAAFLQLCDTMGYSQNFEEAD